MEPNPNSPVWADAPGLNLPTLIGDVQADVCVVGLGGSGLTAVTEALNRGLQVVGIDAGTVACGAAGRNGGFLLAGGAEFHHDAVKRWGHDRALRIYSQTLAEIDAMIDAMPDLTRRVGSLRIAASAEEILDCREQLEVMRADGLAADWYKGPEGEGLRIPTDAGFQPLARCRRSADLARSRGALLFEQSKALQIETGTVVTSQGTIRANLIIVAVDGGMEILLPELSGRVRTCRLQMLATAPTDEVHITSLVYARYGFEYWQQLPDGRVALGGLRDRFGEAEWTTDAVPSEALQGELDQVLRKRVGVKHAQITHRWAGAVGYTSDYLPIVEQVRPDVWAIGGYCGTGNAVGAICGRGVVRLALDGDRQGLGGFLE